MNPDPLTGMALPGVSVQQRTEGLDAQRATLESVLAAADAFAEERRVTLGIVLDEFQTIHRFGGEQAEWHLRGLMERHRALAYVAAGSQEGLIQAMTGKGRAFYKLFEQMHFGPIDPGHMASWIEDRMQAHGIAAGGYGGAIVEAAGPRTRDIVQLARAAYVEAAERGSVEAETVGAAFTRIVLEESESMRADWEPLASSQQNVLRAVAAGAAQLHARETRQQFGLKSTAEVSQALQYLLKSELLIRTDAGYEFDSPFMRGWVRLRALPDVGLRLPVS